MVHSFNGNDLFGHKGSSKKAKKLSKTTPFEFFLGGN